jgi:hypothetical protein
MGPGKKDEEGKPKREYRTLRGEQTINSMVPNLAAQPHGGARREDCRAFYKEKYSLTGGIPSL